MVHTVSLPMPRVGGFTSTDLPRLMEIVDGRFELLDGEVVLMAPSNVWHNEVVNRLYRVLREVAPGHVVVVSGQSDLTGNENHRSCAAPSAVRRCWYRVLLAC